MFELTDAQEHLAALIRDLDGAGNVETSAFAVDLGHVFAHLNRAWYRHKVADDIPDSEWEAASAFPRDLSPVG